MSDYPHEALESPLTTVSMKSVELCDFVCFTVRDKLSQSNLESRESMGNLRSENVLTSTLRGRDIDR
jgi:hypothetical protein